MRKVRTLLRRHRGYELFEGRAPARHDINLIKLPWLPLHLVATK